MRDPNATIRRTAFNKVEICVGGKVFHGEPRALRGFAEKSITDWRLLQVIELLNQWEAREQ